MTIDIQPKEEAMVTFITGMMIGCVLGVLLAALCIMARDIGQ